MVVVASRRNSKVTEDVVEAGRCTCNDADPHIVVCASLPLLPR
jgi:hypothetical protein